jgi:hypothetical protein
MKFSSLVTKFGRYITKFSGKQQTQPVEHYCFTNFPVFMLVAVIKDTK